MARKKIEEDFPEILKPFRFHGVFPKHGPYIRSNNDFVGECPFCGKPRAFVVNANNGKFVCHSKPDECGRSGNQHTFLNMLADELAEGMGHKPRNRLKQLRGGIPGEAFRRWGVGYDYNQHWYTVPVRGEKGHVLDLRVYQWNKPSKRKMGTAGRSAACWNLWGAKEIAGPDAVLYIVEGEWDGMALHWLLDSIDLDYKWAVVALPGARTVKDDWVEVFKRFGRVVVMGDNDTDGDAMAEKVWGKLNNLGGFKGSLRYLNWPETYPDKHDVTDQIKAGLASQLPRRKIWKSILRLIDLEHRRQPFKGQVDVEVAKGGKREVTVERPESNPTFEETMKEYATHLKMTEHHELALQFCFSIYLATQWDDDPLWGFLVGVPGSGKTELLCSMDGCPESVYYSSLQSKGLVSGFKFDPDPSLIPEMIGRCSIFKDFTELLTGNEDAMNDTFDVLRGWYDGHVKRKFGNGVEREYIGRGNIVAGVTNIIHAKNDSSIGERFIKFQLPRPKKKIADDIVLKAMMNTAQEEKRNETLRAAALAFLNRDVPQLTPVDVVPMDYMYRIRALVNLISLLRAKVEFKGYGFERELAVRPDAELPTRLGKQLTKLAMANTLVLGKKKVNDKVFKLVERVAFNTAHGFHLDIIQASMNMGGKMLAIEDLIEESQVPMGTLRKRLEDLVTLNIVNKNFFKTGTAGRPVAKYTVTPSVRRLWAEAEIRDNHIDQTTEARRTKRGWHQESE